MYSLHGTQQVYVYAEKRIIKSSAVGTTDVEEVRWLSDKMVSIAEEWKESGWGYVCCIGEMSPVTADVSEELIELHKKLENSGCKAIAFVNPDAFVIGMQAKKHQKKSKASYKEKHFKTEEEAIEWLEKKLQQ